MTELMETLKLEIESLKSEKETLIHKNKVIYNTNKNQKRSILRLKKIINKLRTPNELNELNELNTEEWELMPELMPEWNPAL